MKTVSVAAVPQLVVRRQAAQSQLSVVVPQLYGEVWNYVRAAHVPSPGRNVAVYPNGAIDLEVAVEVDSTAERAGEIVRSVTPAGRVATATHFGSYARLAEAPSWKPVDSSFLKTVYSMTVCSKLILLQSA